MKNMRRKMRDKALENKNRFKRKIDLKINDSVVILAGDDRGKISKVMKVDRMMGKVQVQGIALRQRYTKEGLKLSEGFIDISNVKRSKNEQVE